MRAGVDRAVNFIILYSSDITEFSPLISQKLLKRDDSRFY